MASHYAIEVEVRIWPKRERELADNGLRAIDLMAAIYSSCHAQLEMWAEYNNGKSNTRSRLSMYL